MEQQREFLSIINEKARELETIISGLLDLSRVESGRTGRLEKEWQDDGPQLLAVDDGGVLRRVDVGSLVMGECRLRKGAKKEQPTPC